MSEKNGKQLQTQAQYTELMHYIDSQEGRLSVHLKSKYDVFREEVIQAFAENQTLLKCDGKTITNCLMHVAQTRLSLNPKLGQAFLVPFYVKSRQRWSCEAIIGYKGMITAAIANGIALEIRARIVREMDDFRIVYGDEEKIQHTPETVGDPGEIIGAYAIAVLPNGAKARAYLRKDELDNLKEAAMRKISVSGRDASRSPWVTHEEAMCKKSAIRRLYGQLPMKRGDLPMDYVPQEEIDITPNTEEAYRAAKPSHSSEFDAKVSVTEHNRDKSYKGERNEVNPPLDTDPLPLGAAAIPTGRRPSEPVQSNPDTDQLPLGPTPIPPGLRPEGEFRRPEPEPPTQPDTSPQTQPAKQKRKRRTKFQIFCDTAKQCETKDALQHQIRMFNDHDKWTEAQKQHYADIASLRARQLAEAAGEPATQDGPYQGPDPLSPWFKALQSARTVEDILMIQHDFSQRPANDGLTGEDVARFEQAVDDATINLDTSRNMGVNS